MITRRRVPTIVLWPDHDPALSPEPVDRTVPLAPQAVPAPGRVALLRPRTWLTAGVVVVLLAQLAWAVALGLAHRSDREHDLVPVLATVAAPQPQVAPSTVQAGPAPVVPARSGPPRPADLAGWAAGLSVKVGIPAVALQAYGTAERVLAVEDPGCHLSWVALAGIGRVESDHGRFGGAVLRPDGRSEPPVVGIALDGNGVATIRDSDGGRLDGDPVHDRAVGPMQFIPTTWARYATDADGDGRADPYALPDAALAAGRYLCRAGSGDLRAAGPWTSAVLAYNASPSYLRRVTEASNGYASASFR